MFNFLKKESNQIPEHKEPAITTTLIGEEQLKKQSPFVDKTSTKIKEIFADMNGDRAMICLIGEQYETGSTTTSVAAAIMIKGSAMISAQLLANLFKANPKLYSLTKLIMEI